MIQADLGGATTNQGLGNEQVCIPSSEALKRGLGEGKGWKGNGAMDV